MPIERVTAAEAAAVHVDPAMSKAEVIDFARRHDVAVWEGRATIEKYWADDPDCVSPYEVVDTDPNLLLTAGVTALWNLAANIGSPTPWSNANAHIAVGNTSSTAQPAASETALKAEQARSPMVTGYPQVSANVITFQASYSTSQANVAWKELAIATGSTASQGVHLNRLVGDWGSKVNSAVWIATMTVSLQ